jgi:ATP-dependent DNA ligase
MKTTMPKLYKESRADGSIEEWSISVDGNAYTVVFGSLNGKMQTKTTVVHSGKNLGKKNATTPEQQALSDAQSKWEKKKLKGYREDIDSATNERLNSLEPMLAKKFNEVKVKPTSGFVQEKLNGYRCVYNNEDKTLWTRGNKTVLTVPHILEACQKLGHSFDGELMPKAGSLQKLGSLVKRDDVHPDYLQVEYHIYDLPIENMPFEKRLEKLGQLAAQFTIFPFLKMVTTISFNNYNVVQQYFNKIGEKGGEGVIIRSANGFYKFGGRSADLIKLKHFDDGEYTIVGGKPDKDGHCVFKCITPEGLEFDVTPEGTHEEKAQYLVDLPNLIGKPLTVRHVGFTEDGLPFHCVGVEVRTFG